MAIGYNSRDATLYVKSPLDTCASDSNTKAAPLSANPSYCPSQTTAEGARRE